MTDWTKEEEEAFNQVEKNSNLGKQILKAQGQPYYWEAEAIQAAIRIEREACAKLCDDHCGWTPRMIGETIRARGNP